MDNVQLGITMINRRPRPRPDIYHQCIQLQSSFFDQYSTIKRCRENNNYHFTMDNERRHVDLLIGPMQLANYKVIRLLNRKKSSQSISNYMHYLLLVTIIIIFEMNCLQHVHCMPDLIRIGEWSLNII